MAHELDMTYGEAAFAYTGDDAWHKLGQKLEPGAPIEEWAEAAHMNWEIKRSSVQFDHNGETGLFPDKHVLYRGDTNTALSVVSKSYKIVQPMEVLEFYRDLVDRAGLELETAGVLFGGRQFWALANTKKFANLSAEDQVKAYVLLSTSCDGTRATQAQFVSKRVVCNNTLSIAVREGGDKIRVPHNRVWKPDEIKEQLGLIDNGWERFKDQITHLSSVKVEADKAAEFFVRLFGDIEVPIDQQSPAVAQKCANIWQLFKVDGMGSQLESANGTWWGALNAVTEFVDHHTEHRTIDSKLNNAWFGAGNTKKTEAFELALAMAA
jgi:phage/plasmid-like protein (TIGR03299 family)